MKGERTERERERERRKMGKRMKRDRDTERKRETQRESGRWIDVTIMTHSHKMTAQNIFKRCQKRRRLGLKTKISLANNLNRQNLKCRCCINKKHRSFNR